jgi:hypothetical protein
MLCFGEFLSSNLDPEVNYTRVSQALHQNAGIVPENMFTPHIRTWESFICSHLPTPRYRSVTCVAEKTSSASRPSSRPFLSLVTIFHELWSAHASVIECMVLKVQCTWLFTSSTNTHCWHVWVTGRCWLVFKSSFWTSILHPRVEVLTTVTVKITALWGSPPDVHWRFGGTGCLNIAWRWRLRNVDKHRHYSILHSRDGMFILQLC